MKRPFSYKKWQILHPRLNVIIIIDSSVSSKFDCNIILKGYIFCNFSLFFIYPDSLFSYFTIIILSVMTAVTFPLRLPRLAFAICGWRWQNDLHEIKYSVCSV